METKRSFSVQWHITDDCDQRCDHCYIYNKVYVKPQELTLSECYGVIVNFVDFCKTMKCDPHFSITGGDPVLSKNLWPILERLKSEHITFSLLGNPFHLTEEVCNRLKELGCRSYQMSIDGLAKTHDTIRKVGSYKATINALPLIKNAGIKACIMSTVSRTNYQELPELVEILVDLGVDIYAFARYCPEANDVSTTLTSTEYREFLSKMWSIYSKLADKGTTFSLKDHLWNLFLKEEGVVNITPEENIVDGCNCGFRHMTILTDGTVYACRRFTSPIGHVLKDSLVDIFNSDALNHYRQIYELEDCKDCELIHHCRGCHAVSYGTFGSFFKKDPQCWKENLSN